MNFSVQGFVQGVFFWPFLRAFGDSVVFFNVF